MSDFDEESSEQELINIIKSKSIPDKLTCVKNILESNRGNLNFNYQDTNNTSKNTALHYAVILKHEDLIRLLIEHGHPVDKIKNAKNQTVLECMSDELKIKLGPLITNSTAKQSDVIQVPDKTLVEKRLKVFVKYFVTAICECFNDYLQVLECKLEKAGNIRMHFRLQQMYWEP